MQLKSIGVTGNHWAAAFVDVPNEKQIFIWHLKVPVVDGHNTTLAHPLGDLMK